MKGQILHVTRGEADQEARASLLEQEKVSIPDGDVWHGYLAGSVVALAVTRTTSRGAELRMIHVRTSLRRLNIGRYMIREIRRLVNSGNERALLHVETPCSDHPFFRSISSELD